jgi:glyoxalase family protein
MQNTITGIHHITAIAGDAQQNYDFYTKTLGLRMVKKTVNFDDPQTYHLYYGDEVGSPGTILTFFPWEGVKQGRNGAGMVTEIGYAVPPGSLTFWKERFEKYEVSHDEIGERFGEKHLAFRDPDGLCLKLIEAEGDDRVGWETPDVDSGTAIKGFHSATLTLNSVGETARVLTDVFGYRLVDQDDNVYRYKTDAVDTAAIIDIIDDPGAPRGINAGGTNHHIAFRVTDEESQMYLRQKVINMGMQITEKINRNYFFSLYFREPGGVLFEIATDNPGFAIDESVQELGSHLKLPERYEHIRDSIERGLPELVVLERG